MAQLAPSPVRLRRPAPQAVRRPALSLITRPDAARTPTFTTVVLSLILVAALATMLLLNISMTQTSYQITRVQGEVRELSEKRQALEERSELLGTPQELERQARQLGMVPAGEVAYVDLNKGTIIGKAGVAANIHDLAPGSKTAPAGDLASRSPYDYGMGNERH